MLSALIPARLRYPAVHLAEQLVNRRSVRHGPLVLVTCPLKTPAPTIDRDRTVSRRSEPSSRATLMGEQPNPWDPLCPSFLPARDVSLPVKRPYAITLYETGYQSVRGHLWKPPLRFWRRPPQSNYPPSNVRASRVRLQTAKGPYFKDGSTNTGVPASKPPAYPTHRMTKVNAKL